MTFKVALLGCGKISSAHLAAWKQTDGFEVVGVFDLDRELASKRGAEFGVTRVFESIDQAVDSCDVVDVATPPQTHARLAQQAIAAGKHLLIEKPIVIHASEWEAIHAALTPRTKLTVIHHMKWAESMLTAKGWIDDGRIGSVIRMRREFLTSAATDRMLVGDSHWSHRLPGGRWFETLPHELYLTHWLCGALELSSVNVASTAAAPPGAPADEVAVVLRGPSMIGTFEFSAHCEVNRRHLTIQGSEGRIDVDILSDLATLTTSKDKPWKRAVGRPLLAAGETLLHGVADRAAYGWRRVKRESPHARAVQAFADYVQDKCPSPTPVEEIDYVVRRGDQIGREIDAQLRHMGRQPSADRIAVERPRA